MSEGSQFDRSEIRLNHGGIPCNPGLKGTEILQGTLDCAKLVITNRARAEDRGTRDRVPHEKSPGGQRSGSQPWDHTKSKNRKERVPYQTKSPPLPIPSGAKRVTTDDRSMNVASPSGTGRVIQLDRPRIAAIRTRIQNANPVATQSTRSN